jgi:hypothetical protein
METINLKSWSEYSLTIKEIREKYKDPLPKILFRGIANSTWKLDTTLERKTKETFSVNRYLEYVYFCVNEIESYTNRRWNLKEIDEIEKEIKEKQRDYRVHLPYYSYLIYLRHHGFPSPLLDWSESPFIAAYFALYEEKTEDKVSIYSFIEMPKGVKSGSGSFPNIHVQGPLVSAHTRHFNQKAWYTVATKYDYDENKHIFINHEEVFRSNEKEQDVLIKINIPITDRIKALKELSDYNINHFTLFQSEDALVKTLALLKFEIDRA